MREQMSTVPSGYKLHDQITLVLVDGNATPRKARLVAAMLRCFFGFVVKHGIYSVSFRAKPAIDYGPHGLRIRTRFFYKALFAHHHGNGQSTCWCGL
jgi:hypothetical protein